MKIAFDIDGVLADNLFYARFVSSWPAFVDAIPNDSAIGEGIALVKALLQSSERHEVCFVTGRPEIARSATTEWLLRNCGLGVKKVLLVCTCQEERWEPDFQLYMRETERHQDPAQYKLNACRMIKPDLVVEDDEESARLLCENGFKVLLFLRKGKDGLASEGE